MGTISGSRREPLDTDKLLGILCTIETWIEPSNTLFLPRGTENFGPFCREHLRCLPAKKKQP